MRTPAGGRGPVKPTVPRLVVFAPNWLGDAVMALPAIADVRRAVPDASLAIAARPRSPRSSAWCPGSTRSWCWEKGSGVFFERCEKDSRPLFDAAILLPNSFHVALTAWRAGVPERWGYRTDWRRPAADARDRSAGGRASGRVLPAPGRSARFIRPVPVHRFPGQPQIVISEELRAIGVNELKGAGWDGRRPLVALAPGAAYGGAKRWPPASFAELARALADDGIQTVMVGGRGRPAGRARRSRPRSAATSS